MPANELNITILKFYTKAREKESDVAYVDPKTGLPEMEDWVSWCPKGQANALVVNEKIKHIERTVIGADDNPTVTQARAKREYIMARYKKWLKAEEVPLEGTPLAMATFLREEDRDAIKRQGIYTIEEFATLPDSARDKIQVPRVRELQRQAIRFIEATDKNATAAKMKVQDDTIAQQAAQLAALQSQMQALLAANAPPAAEGGKRGRGQPKEAEAA